MAGCSRETRGTKPGTPNCLTLIEGLPMRLSQGQKVVGLLSLVGCERIFLFECS